MNELTERNEITEGKNGKIEDRNARIARRVKTIYLAFSVAILVLSFAMPAMAAETNPINVVNNLSDFIFGLIRAVGIILLGWGIVQVGMSFQSHDPSQRSNGFLTLAGGLVITFAKEILNLILGG